MAPDQSTTVELPEGLIERVEDRLPRTEFETPGEYIAFAMEELLFRIDRETDDDDYEGIDEAEVEERLKSLGYLNE